MARKIVITSGKGGVGKTTVCANLGVALALKQQRVCLIDADIGLNNLDVVMNVESRVIYDVLDVARGKCRPKQALVKDLSLDNLFVLPSVKGGHADITSEAFSKIVSGLDKMFDFILIDCPAGVDMGFHRAVVSSDEAIVVTTPSLSSIRDADKTIASLLSYGVDNIGLVVNMIRGDLVMLGEMLSAEDIVKLLRVELLGIVPSDDEINLSNAVTTTLNVSSSKAFLSLADNVTGSSKLLYDYTGKYRGLIGKVRGKLKKIL